MNKASFCIAALLLTALLALPAAAAQKVAVAVVTKPGVGQSMVAEKFAQAMEPLADKYDVRVIYDQGPGGELEILRRLKAGELQMAVITAAPYAKYAPAVDALGYPFLFCDYSHVDKALEGAPGRRLLSLLAPAGFKGLAFSENGFRQLTNNVRRVHLARSLKGLKIRTMNADAQVELWRALGATPVPHSFPINELLASGEVDGQENPLWVIDAYELYKLQKYLSMTGHVYSAHIASANLAWWNSLPPEDQKTMAKAIAWAAAQQRAQNRANERDVLEKLFRNGMDIDLTPDVESFKAKLVDFGKRAIYQRPETAQLLEEFRGAR